MSDKTNAKVEGKKSTRQMPRMPRGFRVSRKYISLKVRRQLLNECGHRCTFYSPDGVRCGSQFQLQVDHVIPLARGGSEEVSNLRILCGVHNRAEAERHGLRRVN